MYKIEKFLKIVTVAFVSTALLVACNDESSDTAQERPATAVVMASASYKTLNNEASFVARVHAIDSFDVLSRVEGFIESKSFVDGALVNAGDVLFTIEQASYINDIDLIKAQIRGAEAIQKEEELSLKRAQELITRGNISQAKVDESEAAVAKAIAEVDRLSASLRQAELQLSYTKIKTPIAGRIGKTEVSHGNLVKPGSEPLAQVISFDPIYVSIAVSEKRLLEVRRRGFRPEEEAVKATIRLSDGSAYEHEGVIDFIDNKVDPTTDTITVRATFPNPNRILFPNQYVAMQVLRTEGRKMLVIPQISIQENQGGKFVLTVDEQDQVVVRNVELGREVGESIIVTQGLEEGEPVIVQGIQKVRPGQKVSITMTGETNSDGN